MLDVALLGTGGMMPLPKRFLTSLLIRLNGNLMLIDCGEGTQVTMKTLGWGYKNIDVICITHFHADHVSGLPGLLLTIGNSGRTEPITIIGPVGLGEIVKGLCVIARDLPFEFKIVELDRKDHTLTVGDFIINVFPLNHRIACFAYSLSLFRAGKFDLNKAKSLNIPVNYWSRLQNGEDVEFEGKTYTSDMVLGNERKGLKVSYATDSRPVNGLAQFVSGSDLFVCEGLYGDPEKFEKTAKHMHMMFSEAATIAQDANVSELWLTHFSPALVEPKAELKYATDIFKNAKVGFDRMNKTLLFQED